MATFEELAIFATLVFIEVILGIDNIVVLAVLVDKLPEEQKSQARAIGLSMAYVLRVLFVILALKIKNVDYSVNVLSHPIEISSLLFGFGGFFLVVKGLSEIKHMSSQETVSLSQSTSFTYAVMQIMFIDLVFSFDSVLTAIALTSNQIVIILAITIAILSMYLTSGIVSKLIKKFERLKLLALLFVVLVGIYLLLEAFHMAFDRTYLFAMIAFCICYEVAGYLVLSRSQ